MSRRHPATTVVLALTGIFALGAFIQPFTAGLGIFGDSFEAHRGLGFILHGLTLLTLIAALIAPTRRRDAPLAFGLFALVTIQLFVVEADASAVQALHPLLGVSALLLAAYAHLQARRGTSARTGAARAA
jgi:hypothetical protein